MSVFSISDLHLSLATPKPMDIFGSRWQGYTEKLEKNWRAVVTKDDTVVIPGDISWAMSLEEAEADLRFISSLPGKKLLGKGNHDFWWETLTKMRRYLADKNITGIDFLYNNAYLADDLIICGTRGWFIEERLQNTVSRTEYTKVSARELSRLKLSLDEAVKIQKNSENADIVVYLHFPPAFGDFVCGEYISLMKDYGVRHCYFGHIHGVYSIPRTTVTDGLPISIISADYLNFTPMLTKLR